MVAEINTVVNVCDVCGVNTQGFYYYREETDPFGATEQLRLHDIDLCRDCAEVLRYKIKSSQMVERYGGGGIPEEDIYDVLEEFKRFVEKNTSHGFRY